MNEGGSTILSKESLLEDSANMTLLARLDNVKMLQLTTNKRGTQSTGLNDWDQVLDILRNGKRTETRKGTTSLCVFHIAALVKDEYFLTLFVGKDQLRYPLLADSDIFHIINGNQNDFVIQLDVENYWLVWQDSVSDSGLQVHELASILAKLANYKIYGGTIASRLTTVNSDTVDKTLPRLPGRLDTIPSMSMPTVGNPQPSVSSGHFTEHMSQSAGAGTLLKVESDAVSSYNDGKVHTQMSTVHEEQEEIEAAIATLLRSRIEADPSAVVPSSNNQHNVDSDNSDVEPITPAAASELAAAVDYLEVHSRKPTLEPEPERTRGVDDRSVHVFQNLSAASEREPGVDAELERLGNSVPPQSMKQFKDEPLSADLRASTILDSTELENETLLQENGHDTQAANSQFGDQMSMMEHIGGVHNAQEQQSIKTVAHDALDGQQSGPDAVENIICADVLAGTPTPSAAEEAELPEFVMQNLPRRSASTSSSARNSTYRNSIVVVDDETGDVVGVVQEDLVMEDRVLDSTKIDEDVLQSLAAIDATLKGSLHSQAMSLTSTVFDRGSNEQSVQSTPVDALIAQKASARQRSASQHSVEPSTATTVYHDAEDSAEWFEEQEGDQQEEVSARPETSFFPLEGDDDASAVEVDVDNDGHLTITSARNISSEAIVARPYHLPLLGYVTTFASWFSNIIGLSWVLGWKKESKDSSRIQAIHDHQKLHRERMNGRKLSLRYHDDVGRPRKVYLASRGTAFLEARSAFI